MSLRGSAGVIRWRSVVVSSERPMLMSRSQSGTNLDVGSRGALSEPRRRRGFATTQLRVRGVVCQVGRQASGLVSGRVAGPEWLMRDVVGTTSRHLFVTI